MIFQLGWATLPSLRGIGVSDFRATATDSPDNIGGVTVELANQAECDAFLQRIEAEFAARRFTNGGDAFDAVKAYLVSGRA
jgi:hypothetical protein